MRFGEDLFGSDRRPQKVGRGTLHLPDLANLESLNHIIRNIGDIAKRKVFRLKGAPIRIATLRTGEVRGAVLALWTDDKILAATEDRWKPASICAIPWNGADIDEWVAAFGPIEIRTGTAADTVTVPNPVVVEALRSLTSSVNLGTGLGHPSDHDAAVGSKNSKAYSDARKDPHARAQSPVPSYVGGGFGIGIPSSSHSRASSSYASSTCFTPFHLASEPHGSMTNNSPNELGLLAARSRRCRASSIAHLCAHSHPRFEMDFRSNPFVAERDSTGQGHSHIVGCQSRPESRHLVARPSPLSESGLTYSEGDCSRLCRRTDSRRELCDEARLSDSRGTVDVYEAAFDK